MAPLLYFRNQAVSAGGALEYVRLHLGHVKLRIANCDNAGVLNPPCRISLAIVQHNDPNASMQTISLFHRQDQVESTIDVGWEGEIEIDQGQDLIASFELSTLNDILFLTVGVEPL